MVVRANAAKRANFVLESQGGAFWRLREGGGAEIEGKIRQFHVAPPVKRPYHAPTHTIARAHSEGHTPRSRGWGVGS